MNSYLDIKQQFEAIFSQVEPMLTSSPERLAPHIKLLHSMFNVLFELTSRQIAELRESIEKLTKTIDGQTQTIDRQNLQIQALLQKREQALREKSEQRELIKSMKTLLRSKDVDMDALKRILFAGGREQKKEKSEPAPAKADRNDQSENDGGKKKAEKRKRQSNKDKLDNCDADIRRYLTLSGNLR